MIMPPSHTAELQLPENFRQALWRGIRFTCPKCGGARLFRRWLKPVDRCPSCQLDLTPQQADDFPAYIAIFVTGHLMAPLIIMLVLDFALSPQMLAAVILPLATAMIIAMLQPAKGAVIAVQWWNGMHGFIRERVETSVP